MFGAGDQVRNIMYVEDAVDILWRAWQEPRLIGETYFATSDQHLPVREIADAIVDVFGRGKVTHVDWPDERRRIEIEHVRFSSSRLRDITGLRDKYDLVAGLEKTMAVLEQQK